MFSLEDSETKAGVHRCDAVLPDSSGEWDNGSGDDPAIIADGVVDLEDIMTPSWFNSSVFASTPTR